MQSVKQSLSKLLFIFLLGSLFSCAGPTKIKDGRTAHELKRYTLAVEMLPAEISKAGNEFERNELMKLLADSYWNNNQMQDAAREYTQLAREFPESEVLLRKAESLMCLEKYDEAVEAWEALIKFDPLEGKRARKRAEACNKALEQQSERSNIRVLNLEGVNSPSADFSLAPFENGSYLFTSSRSEAKGDERYEWTGEQFGDLYLLETQAGEFGEPMNFDELLNTEWYEGTACLHPNGTELYFSRCGSEGKTDDFCRIYRSQRIAGSWGEPEEIPFFNDSTNCAQPWLSPDGSKLYFSSDAEDGFGGKDIYQAEWQDTGWGFPINAGTRVNTEYDELFPTIGEDGRMYFSSNGHNGYGGLDIYEAIPGKRLFQSIEHMPWPINGGGDDFGLIWTKTKPNDINDPLLKSGFLTSSRPGGKGRDDLYSFRYENVNYFILLGIVVEKKYEDPDDPDSRVIGNQRIDSAKVELFYTDKDRLDGVFTTQNDGRFRSNLKVESDYRIFASKDGYFNKSATVTTKGRRSIEQLEIVIEVEIELERIWPTREITIPNIYYDLDKATLRPESLPVLDSVLVLFIENPELTIEIGSHTDSRGNNKYNEELSQRRAQSVIDYLASKEVNAEKLIAKGYGESRILNGCTDGVRCTEEQHQENRRTTFRVVLDSEENTD